MGLMSKLKNILFEEEEVEIPVLEKKDKKEVKKEDIVYKDMPLKTPTREQTYRNDSFYDDLEPSIEKEKKLEDNHQEKKEQPSINEREVYKSEKTFNFPDFDEEEFENFTPKPRPNNILEREKKANKREYIEPPKEEPKSEEKKFRPSPIISPVYGILDKNYTPDEITSRQTNKLERKLDVDIVRKKAFGSLKEEKVELKEENIEDTENDLLEEKLKKARTIDELLKDSSDEVITLNEDEQKEKTDESNIDNMELLEEQPELEETSDIKLEEASNKHEKNLEDDTLESDLFDLIDSMYENREDGE